MRWGRQRNYAEDYFHVTVADFLRVALPVDAWWTTIPTGNLSPVQAAKMKRKGYRRGTPDVLIIYCGKPYWLELKAGKNPVDVDQVDCQYKLLMAGSPSKVVRTIDEAIAALTAWGFRLRAHEFTLRAAQLRDARGRAK